MATSYYQSVKIKPRTVRTADYLVGDIAYTGVLLSSSLQQLYDTHDPYLLRFLTEEEKSQINRDDAKKIELSYMITNSIKMWLMSKIGDYGRFYPGMGGPLDEYIGKVISDDRAREIEESLRLKIERTFNSILTVDALTVTPSPEHRSYIIQLTLNYIVVKKAFSVSMELNI